MASPVKISVVICAYNAAQFIREAIDSVLAQNITKELVEIIVVDDGSTDETSAILKENYATAIKYLYQKNAGQATAMNNAFVHAAGEYIAFLDADDFWEKEKLSKVLAVFENDQAVDVVYTYVRIVDKVGQTIGSEPDKNNTNADYLSDQHLKEFLAGRIPYSAPTGIAIRKSCLDKLGRLPEEVSYPDTIMRYILPFYANKIFFIREHLCVYRFHDKNSWVNKSFSKQIIVRDIAMYKFLYWQVEKHGQITGHDVERWLSRLEREIVFREILGLRCDGKIISAVWRAATCRLPVYDRHKYRLLYRAYTRVNLLCRALLPHERFEKIQRWYAKGMVFRQLHLLWART